MGTSSAFGGPAGGTPLVPTWLEPNGATPAATPAEGGTNAPAVPPAPPDRPLPPQAQGAQRFAAARNNFSRFVGSGGSDRGALGRSVSGYVSKASGGASTAARRMGASRIAGARLVGFLSDVRERGAVEALRALNLEALAGRPIEQVFLGIAEFVCPDGGTIDDGIARDAFIETIAELASQGITDLDTLTADQMQTVFELFVTHSIEGRLCNDVGSNVVTLPPDLPAAERVQAQLHDFISRGVSDAITAARTAMEALTPTRVLGFVDGVYRAAFGILQTLGEAEASA